MEKELRKYESPSGTWVKLGDGELWCIPALPLGDKCNVILDSLEALYETQEQPIPEKETAKETINRSRDLLAKSANFAYLLLNVNYPSLTREKFNEANLVTIQHCNLLQKIVHGGTKLGEIIGESEPGEAMTATG